MNKILQWLLIGILIVSLAGCVTVEKVVRERVDQDISGNQGYIQGRSPAPGETRATTREYIDVRVEVPTWQEVKEGLPKQEAKPQKPRVRREDKEMTGNLGYISKSRGFEEELPPMYKPEPVVSKPAEYEYEETEEAVAAPAQTYKVKEGDSLSKIAKDFYGKASKWTVIYEANPDKIKDPNRVKAGTVLVMPEPEEIETGQIK